MEPVIILIALAAGVAIGWLAAAAQSRRGGTLRDAIGAEAADALERVQEQLVSLERGRIGSDATLREQVRAMSESSAQLRTETSQLVAALRAPQIRGRWGEVQLERIVEAAGMKQHVDYVTQPTLTADGTSQRPDLVVRLAGGKQVVVDAKVAFSAYLEATEARDEANRATCMRAHARQVRAHVDALSAKAYWRRFTPTPEFVVCFLPADVFLDAALREDPSLLEHAFERDIVLATPSTLMALLRTVAYSWRQEALATNAEEVHRLGRDLHRRLATMAGHLDRLGRSLGTAVGAYNDTVGSLERRVLSTARQFGELGVVGPHERLDGPAPLLDAVPRPLTAGELAESKVVPLRDPPPRLSGG